MILSLQIEIELLDDNTYLGDAPWLSEPMYGTNFEDLYWRIVRERHLKEDATRCLP